MEEYGKGWSWEERGSFKGELKDRMSTKIARKADSSVELL